MEVQEKSFEDLLREDRLKRLERQLKLNNIKGGAGSPQLTASPHMSISSLSSIHGDNGALSDFSFSAIPSNFSSRAASVVASSINLRTELLKKLKKKEKTMPTTSSEIDHRSDVENIDKDKRMMPPPSLKKISSNHKLESAPARQRCGDSGDERRVDNVDDEEISKETGKNNNSDSKQRGGRVFKNWTVRLNGTGQIIIKGKLESGEMARSKAVKKRVNATTVISVLNHRYHIFGDIYDLREELPEYIRGKFYNGFPTDWENVRQIWQCYIASGSSSRFRWPRPVADSDDDIRSDITELTTSRSTRNSVLITSVDVSRHCQSLGKETSGNNATRNADSKRGKTAMDSDISSIESAMEEEDFRNEVETSNPVKKMIEETENSSNNCQVKSSNAGVGCSNCGNLIPRRKIDIIVDNMMNKNCSVEYIDRVLTAINRLNELLVILPTTTTATTMTMTNNIETAPDEGVSMNYNSNTQYESTGNVAKPKASRDKAGSTEGRKNQAIISHSNSYSLESSDESEKEESRTKRDAFIREKSTKLRTKQNDSQSKSLHQLTQPLSSSPTLFRQLAGRFVGDDPNRGENKKIMGVYSAGEEMANKLRNRVDNRRKKSVCSTSISGVETLAMSEAASPCSSSFVAINSKKIVEPETRSIVPEKMSQVKATPKKNYDSDISIVDRLSTLEKKETFSADEKDGGNDRVDSRTTNARSNKKILNSSPSVCMVRLKKITTEQNNISGRECQTPSKSATPTRKKSRNDVSQESNDALINNLENVSMRMSSRGRRILPPLHFWEGERLVFRDKELLYESGVRRTSSVNTDILQRSVTRSNVASVSQLASNNISDENLDEASKEKTDSLKPATNQKTKHLRRGHVLSEIPNNHEAINDYATTSEKRYSTRSAGEKIEKPRNGGKYAMTSSSEEETNICTAMLRRKKRRIY